MHCACEQDADGRVIGLCGAHSEIDRRINGPLRATVKRLTAVLTVEHDRHQRKNHNAHGNNPAGFFDDRCDVCQRFAAALKDDA